MAELAIKIKIAEREYPMRVDEQDEERLRIAGRLINERLKFFKDQFRIEDKQDLLAMVVFECMAEKLLQENEIANADQQIGKRLTAIQDLMATLKID
jgi:cell division protein ZapA